MSAAVQAARREASAWPAASGARERALALAEIVGTLAVDDAVVLAALALPLLESGALASDAIEPFGEEALRLARALGGLGQFGLPAQWNPQDRLSGAQAETLRKMLLAIVTDPRLIVLRLADHLLALRRAKSAAPAEQRRLALEAREIYAPLANRLGVWQLKWELEDLAFRYLEPEDYRRIAAALKMRRSDRERYIEDVRGQLEQELTHAGIRAEVVGRPKHIHSIWRKMRQKQLAFEQVLDVRAVRVLVDTVADCYGALGVVHGLWRHIPGEFDDYIATPKDNAYRSLHTAVFGPGDEPLEVQVRTREMHEHAELGVAAHWKYKEGGARDAAYESKIKWVRQLLEPADDEVPGDFIDRVRAEIFEDRVYALSPRGDVIDLPQGATPLDFAYHVHTELGHRCRGAKVNGRIVPLTHRLANGEVVEIVTARVAQPSRDWLSPQLGFLVSPRSRAKVRSFFRKQDEERNRVQGRELLERELTRFGTHGVTLPELIGDLGFKTATDLYAALGNGDVNLAQVANALQRRVAASTNGAMPRAPKQVARVRAGKTGASSGIVVQGVGDLMSNFARCCRPVPPEPIVGYITQGRGVSIHRQSCASLLRMRSRQAERIIGVEWGERQDRLFAVEIAVHAFDRRGLVRDISAVLADEKISIEQMTTNTNARENTADVALRVGVHGLEELSRVLSRIGALPNVVRARRTV
jgi:GTP pyrophosphokinase